MNKKIIIIEGYLASGKSTFALQLSKATGAPYLMKDTFKSALCESISIKDREESLKYSVITFDAMMYAAERMMEAGCPVILEGNFAPAGVKKKDESEVIRKLINKYGYCSLTFKFMGDTHVLHERFLEREKTPERGQANKMRMEVSWESFNEMCHALDDFSVGGDVIRVDTTNFGKADFDRHLETVKQFMISG